MKKVLQFKILVVFLSVGLFLSTHQQLKACSTFMLHKGGKLIFGYNLNEGDLAIPGILFVNKRGVFKMGRSLNEMMFKEVKKPSKLSWISQYGSVTFNVFGRDLPNGGMNEAGFFIEEMNGDTEYPQGDSLQKLSQMSWIQYLLDNCATIDEAFELTKNIEIDGWNWHYFLGDASGDCASLTFVKGKMKINRGKNMPIKGLFNTPYDREMEIAKYFKNFGGLYEVEMDNPNVPRFVKAKQLIQNFDPAQNIVDYGFYILDKIQVNDKPEWSIVFDPIKKQIFFRTRLNPEIKELSFNDLDFSSKSELCLIQNIDVEQGGNIKELLHPYTEKEMKGFLVSFVSLIGDGFFRVGGLEPIKSIENLTNNWERAEDPRNQFFKGRWVTKPKKVGDKTMVLNLESNKNAVSGEVTTKNGSVCRIDHLFVIDKKITLTFLTKSGRLLELKGEFVGDKLEAKVYGIESYLGKYVFYREAN